MRSLLDLIEVESAPGARALPIERLRELERYFDETAHVLASARTELALARALLASGAYEEADRAFVHAIELTERRRASVATPRERARFLDRARGLFDEMIAFQVDRGDAERSFEFAERMRARVLLESAFAGGGGEGPAPYAAGEVAALLPPDVAAVSFAVLPGRVVAWTTHGGRTRLTTLRSAPEEIRARSEALRASIRAGERLADASSWLYGEMVGPALEGAESVSRVVVVPDRWLHALPVGALADEASTFAAQRWDLVVAPSVTTYLRARAEYAVRSSDANESVLAIGNPSFDATVFKLPSLVGAEREAQAVAAVYGDGAVWLRDRATPSAFLGQAPAYDVIHVAAHAIVRPDRPERSHIVLARDEATGSGGGLFAEDLRPGSLPQTRLVVLSACETSVGAVSGTEGPMSLANAFFSVGVPVVVASLWPVPDDATADFFEAFHRHLAVTGDPAAALRATQRSLIEGEGVAHDPAIWAAFQVYGGV